MGLMPCPECGAEVSSGAEACLRCGFSIAAHQARLKEETRLEEYRERVRDRNRVLVPLTVIALLGGVAIVVFLASVMGKASREGSRADRPRPPRLVTYYSTADSLNVRAEPDLAAETVRQLIHGERVRIKVGSRTETGGHSWLATEDGWVADRYLSKTRPLSEKEKIAGSAPRLDKWDGSYFEVKKHLRRTMHDPDSLEWVGCTKVFWEKDVKAYLVGCTFRGSNAFGAKIKNSKWFLIRHETVIAVREEDAYSWGG